MTKAVLLLALAALTACGSPCQDLADRICNCQPAGVLRDNCRSSVRNQLGQRKPSAADERYCESKLATCPDPEKDTKACNTLATGPGKVACGLAFDPAP